MAAPEPPEVEFELKERAMDEAPVGITLTDPGREDNPLIYINDAFERVTGYPRESALGRNCRFLQGEDTDPADVAELRSGIEAAEPVTVELVNYRADGEPFWNEVTVAPLRDDDGVVTHYVGFQVDVSRRKEAQFALAAERERLDRLVDRINGLLADVTELLMQGVDRAATEQAIAERIAASDPYRAAWIGEPDLAEEVLAASSAAGFEDAAGATVPIDADSPVARAYRDRVVATGEPGDEPALAPDDSSGRLAAVPLVYGDATYGVLAVVGVDAAAVDDRELVVLESIGRTVATAINAAQSRRGLTADDLVELEFTVADRDFFAVALAAAWDCRLVLRGTSAGPSGGLRLFLDAEGGTPADDDPALDLEGVEEVVHVPADGTELVEVVLPAGSVIDRLAERGAEVRSLSAEDGVAALEIVVPAETGGRVVLELLEDRYDGVELVSYRERERRPTTKSALVTAIEEALTERQATALRSAYYSGYYDDPRTTSGDELADAMGVSRPTFHQHLRAAERKLFAAVLD